MTQKPQPQQGSRTQTEVLIIGSGIAGLSYLLTLLEKRPETKAILVAKKTLQDSNSYYAQGGIAAATQGDDSAELHLQDTLRAGCYLNQQAHAEAILKQGSDAIAMLKKYGVPFSRQGDEFSLAQEGGHSARRVYNCGDHTGKSIINSLIDAVKAYPNVTVYEHHIAVELITKSYSRIPEQPKEVIGAYILNESNGMIDTTLANVVVLATGGAGKVFRYTSNPDTATGDGIAMAYRAGARVGNLEFYQFHPTLLYHPQVNNFLISEAVRGEGAHLLHPGSKQRFMKDYAPKAMELATRDIVSKAIFTEIEKSDFNFVYLDTRHINVEVMQSHFPVIFSTLNKLGINPSQDLIPVVPAAHYLCGGILTNIHGQTDLHRLYAIGETGFTGLHGANRLASNSLLEGVVVGKLAANHSLDCINKAITVPSRLHDWDSQHVTDLRRASQINAHWRGLRGEMTSYAGIVRTHAGLSDLLNLILTRRTMVEGYYRKHTVTRDIVELRNIILVAKLIVTSALKRKESRGGHFREDFPQASDACYDTLLRNKEIQFNYQEQ